MTKLTSLLTVFAIGLGAVAQAEPRQGDIVPLDQLPRHTVYDHWDQQKRFRANRVFQNVMAEDMVELLAGKVQVTYFEDGGRANHYGIVRVRLEKSDGTSAACIASSDDGIYNWDDGSVAWWPARVGWPLYSLSVSLLAAGERDNPTYGAIQYNGNTGQFAMVTYLDGSWWDFRKGHLQEGIPAVVYDVCPGFPSAASLGTFVNERQTSTNYFELIQQDPGQRVLRPDLVSQTTATYYFRDE